jgi:hypothetical protein
METGKQAMRHLKENNMSYPTHWWRAMSMSVALFIHAWVPNWFSTYASDKMRGGSNG